jgi:hypothetical protein
MCQRPENRDRSPEQRRVEFDRREPLLGMISEQDHSPHKELLAEKGTRE